MTERVIRVPTPSTPLITQGNIALSDSEKDEALTDGLETRVQPEPAFIEKFNEAIRAYFFTPASELKLTF